jgi:hypothetical protein
MELCVGIVAMLVLIVLAAYFLIYVILRLIAAFKRGSGGREGNE